MNNMSNVGEHTARIKELDQFEKVRLQRNKFGDGIHVIYGETKGKSQVQSLRFDADKYTADTAKEWIAKHDYTPILFEQAITHKENASAEKFSRELGLDFILAPEKIDTLEGGLLIKGVKLLAEGEWTDSAVQTPLFYPAKTLAKDAHNWLDTSVWSRHTGGVPRSITDKVGEIRNPHFEDNAVVGDVYLHGLTAASRDTIELVKSKMANYVSVEHGGDERYNPESKRMEAQNLFFTGLAIVNRGACARCRINSAIETQSQSHNSTALSGQPAASDCTISIVGTAAPSENEAVIPALPTTQPSTNLNGGTIMTETTQTPTTTASTVTTTTVTTEPVVATPAVELSTPVVPTVTVSTDTAVATTVVPEAPIVTIDDTTAKALSALQDENKSLKESLARLEQQNKELADALSKLGETMKSLSAMDERLRKVEASPVEPKTVLGSPKELEEPKIRVTSRNGVLKFN